MQNLRLILVLTKKDDQLKRGFIMAEWMISETALTVLVSGAVFITIITPVALVAFLVKDWKEGKLW